MLLYISPRGGLIMYKNSRLIVFWCLLIILNLMLFFLLYKSGKSIINSRVLFQIENLKERSPDFYIYDFNKDYREEILALFPGQPYPNTQKYLMFSPFTPRGDMNYSYIDENLIPSGESALPPQDIDQDGQNEFPTIKTTSNEIILSLYNPPRFLKHRIHFPISQLELPKPLDLPHILFDDLDNDGTLEMVAAFEAYYQNSPRGILVFSIKDGRVLWQFRYGCLTLAFYIADLDRDGTKSVIISGWGSNSRANIDGIDDAHSYLIVLDHNGNKRWKERELGGYYTKLFLALANFDDTRRPSIVIAKSCHRDFDPEPGEIRIIDSLSGEDIKAITDEEATFSNVYVRSLNGVQVIVVGDDAGRITLFDRDLRILKRARFSPGVRVCGIQPLGSNLNREYILIQSGGDKLLVLNDNLENAFSLQVQRSKNDNLVFQVRPIQDGADMAAIVNADQMYLLRKPAFSLRPFLSLLTETRFIFLLLILLGLDSLFLYGNLNHWRNPIANKYRIDWLEDTQEIVHRMKSPLFAIQLEAEKLDMLFRNERTQKLPAQAQSIPSSIIRDVDKLNSQLQFIMNFISFKFQNRKKVDIHELINKVVKKYADLFKGRVHFELNLDPEAIRFNIDPVQIETALSNLIQNAVEAISQNGKVIVSSLTRHSPVLRTFKGIDIEVMDNGVGIPENALKDVFKPFFTTKPQGTGIGLTIAKKIIEAHGGKIEVQSKKGIGTIFAVFLPWKDRLEKAG